jgi:radical SAM protein with 4Fe4S-binding SPASM domain
VSDRARSARLSLRLRRPFDPLRKKRYQELVMRQFPYCDFPESLMVQTTTRCDAACVFCPYPAVRREIQHGEMSFTLFAKLMRECARHPEVRSINLFLMNEPLLDPLIVDRCNFAKEQNPRAAICLWTNGCRLDEELARGLIGSRLDAIGVSIHAMWPETYHQLTGRRDFEEVLARVTRFVKLRDQLRPNLRVEIRLVGVRQLLSQEEVDEAVAYWSDLQIEGVHSLLGHVSRAGNVPGTYQVIHRKIRGCSDRMPYHMAAVVQNGDVVLCCMDWRREQVLGNIRDQSLASIWRSEQRRKVLAALQGECSEPDFLCKRCEESIAAQ